MVEILLFDIKSCGQFQPSIEKLVFPIDIQLRLNNSSLEKNVQTKVEVYCKYGYNLNLVIAKVFNTVAFSSCIVSFSFNCNCGVMTSQTMCDSLVSTSSMVMPGCRWIILYIIISNIYNICMNMKNQGTLRNNSINTYDEGQAGILKTKSTSICTSLIFWITQTSFILCKTMRAGPTSNVVIGQLWSS